MTWEQQLLDLFDDLEQRAEGLALTRRDAEVAELARAEYAEVELDSRLHASVGRAVELRVLAIGPVRGRLAGAGAGWCLVATEAHSAEWVVATDAVLGYKGLADGARPEHLRPVTARLGLGSVLRRLSEQRDPVVVVSRDGDRRSGTVARVGADFLELVPADGGAEVLPLGAVVALRGRR